MLQYECKRPFERFGQSVSQARREGDTHPSFALLAETSKLVGNRLVKIFVQTHSVLILIKRVKLNCGFNHVQKGEAQI